MPRKCLDMHFTKMGNTLNCRIPWSIFILMWLGEAFIMGVSFRAWEQKLLLFPSTLSFSLQKIFISLLLRWLHGSLILLHSFYNLFASFSSFLVQCKIGTRNSNIPNWTRWDYQRGEVQEQSWWSTNCICPVYDCMRWLFFKFAAILCNPKVKMLHQTYQITLKLLYQIYQAFKVAITGS